MALISCVSDLVHIIFSLDISCLTYKMKSLALNYIEDSDVLSMFLIDFYFFLSKCSITTLFKVYFLVVLFFSLPSPLSVSFFNIWDRRILSKSEGKEEEEN